MAVWIGMLRGVNVGGAHKVPMERLRSICAALGFGKPQTFIQSGNVVFEADERDRLVLAARMEDELEREFGFRAAVILRSRAEMRGVVTRNPFAGREDVAPHKLLVTFLDSDPGEAARLAVRGILVSPEELFIDGSELFIYYPAGSGQSKLPVAKIDRAHGQVGTSRNWNSVLKLMAMAEER